MPSLSTAPAFSQPPSPWRPRRARSPTTRTTETSPTRGCWCDRVAPDRLLRPRAEGEEFAAAGGDALRRAQANEREHLASVAGILTGAGQVATAPVTSTFVPGPRVRSRGSIAKLGVELETLALGAYLGAVAAIRPRSLAGPLARIAASEAQHLSAVQRRGDRPLPRPVVPRATADRDRLRRARPVHGADGARPSIRHARRHSGWGSASTRCAAGTRPARSRPGATPAIDVSSRPRRSSGCAATRARTC